MLRSQTRAGNKQVVSHFPCSTEKKEWLNEVKFNLAVTKYEANISVLDQCWKTWVNKYGSCHSEPPSSPTYYTQKLMSITIVATIIHTLLQSATCSILIQTHIHNINNATINTNINHSTNLLTNCTLSI